MTIFRSTYPRVLVADDDPSIRNLVCTIVRREGLEVDSVSDGAEAIEQLEQHDYTLILLDLMMPKMDGFGVIEYLRSHRKGDKPVVLVITAYDDQRFKKVDPDIVAGVLHKPFEVSDLGSIIRLCARGGDQSLQEQMRLAMSRAVRDFAAGWGEGEREN